MIGSLLFSAAVAVWVAFMLVLIAVGMLVSVRVVVRRRGSHRG